MADRLPTIAVAVVIDRGRVLVGRRRQDSADAPGLHEFPGGKVERGESAAAAAVRETIEETGLAIRIGPQLAAAAIDSSRGPETLVFFAAAPVDPAARPRDPFGWVDIGDLPRLSFPPANREVLAWLARPAARRKQ